MLDIYIDDFEYEYKKFTKYIFKMIDMVLFTKCIFIMYKNLPYIMIYIHYYTLDVYYIWPKCHLPIVILCVAGHWVNYKSNLETKTFI